MSEPSDLLESGDAQLEQRVSRLEKSMGSWNKWLTVAGVMIGLFLPIWLLEAMKYLIIKE